MADIVNLRRFRKKRARADHEAIAEENRARHGRSKGARELIRSEADKAGRHLDGHRLSDAPTDELDGA